MDAEGGVLALTLTESDAAERILDEVVYGAAGAESSFGEGLVRTWYTTTTSDFDADAYMGGEPFAGGSLEKKGYSKGLGAASEGAQVRGLKLYELRDHLGNVTVVVSDRALPVDDAGVAGLSAAYFRGQVKSARDFYPYGMVMVGRRFDTPAYRYGFQGQEGDDELFGEGNSSVFKFRALDSRLGHFFSVDPLTSKYPELSPFQFAQNSIILMLDVDGLEGVPYNGPDSDPGGDRKRTLNVAIFPNDMMDHNGFISLAYGSAKANSDGVLIIRASDLQDAADKISQISVHANVKNVFFIGHGSPKGSWDIANTSTYNINRLKPSLVRIGESLNQDGVISSLIFYSCSSGNHKAARRLNSISNWTETISLGNQSWTPSTVFAGEEAVFLSPDHTWETAPIRLGNLGEWSVAIPNTYKGRNYNLTEQTSTKVKGVYTIPAITTAKDGSVGIISKEKQLEYKEIRDAAKEEPSKKLKEIVGGSNGT